MNIDKLQAKFKAGLAKIPVNSLVLFFRRNFQCRFGVHWRMKYDSGMKFDICQAGTCTDCGYRTEGIKITPPPPCKPPKCNSCQKGYDGTNGNGYQPCGCKRNINP